jgi:hypothetical protein
LRCSLRKQINVALLDAEGTDWWKDVLFQYLGQSWTACLTEGAGSGAIGLVASLI